MAPAAKVSAFQREGNDWFCNAGLPSDVIVGIDGTNFHLHKFPLISKCGRIAKLLEESISNNEGIFTMTLEDFPGGPDTFLIAAKFCYGIRVEFTPRNIVTIYCAADYLEMAHEYGEDNLLPKSENFFHKNILRSWKDCIVALQSSEPLIQRADKVQIISKCLDALSMMVCTDPTLFGWPMMMYGKLQSPGGSILWNGINTGARIQSSESDWWFEDISYIGVVLFERLIRTMETRGIRPDKLGGAIMHYARKYLPGLGRWQGVQGGKTITVASFSLTPAAVDQKLLLESVVKFFPEKKGKSFCRFLLGLLRVALILGVNRECQDYLERRIGLQLELATLDSILIPTYSDSDALYNTECVERIIQHFVSIEPREDLFSPASFDLETSPSYGPLRKVAKLIDGYIAEIASDVNLKPGKIRSLAESLPESSRSLHDGLYRALDIYFKAHPWIPEKEKEELCTVIDCQKLSIDACAHASQNERLPLRVVLQVLFFEQLQLKTALAGCLNVLDVEGGPPTGPITLHNNNDTAGQIVQRDGWVTVVRENQVLRGHMENMRSRVGELEEEFSKIKLEMKKATKSSHCSISSPRVVARRRSQLVLLPSSDDEIDSPVTTPRPSAVQSTRSRHSSHRKTFPVI